MIRKLLPGLLAIGFLSHASAATVEGVVFPERCGVDGYELTLNGAGLRWLTVFHIRAYVAGLYLQAPSHDARQILSAPGTKVIVMEFLHAGSKADVERQYRRGEEENCGHGECDPADKDDFERLIAAAPGVEPGDTFTYVINDRGVRLLHNNRLVIDIPNKDLGFRILSGFIGAHPPSQELKTALLGLPAE